jgi:hypothetical protein
MPEINTDFGWGISRSLFVHPEFSSVAGRMVFKKLLGKGRKHRTERERQVQRRINRTERTVEIEMEAEESPIDPGPHELRKISMKAIYGNRKILPRDRDKRLVQKLISTTSNREMYPNGCESALTQIQKSTMKANHKKRNTPRQGFQQMKEYKWILMMNNKKMLSLRFDSVSNLIQKLMMKSNGNPRNRSRQ